MKTISRITALVLFAALSACATDPKPETGARQTVGLYPNETPELRALINEYAKVHDVPPSLIHRVIQRESDYRPNARNGPYYGMMQILPATARTMGFRGSPSELLDPEVTLRYAGRYLRGPWLVSDGNEQKAVMWYARGYYYEARDRCMLRVTRLADRERC